MDYKTANDGFYNDDGTVAKDPNTGKTITVGEQFNDRRFRLL